MQNSGYSLIDAGFRAICNAFLLLLAFSFEPAFGSQPVGEAAESITGGHTRVVWVQDQSRPQNDTLARGRNLVLMGFDSRDGNGERPILRAPRNYVKPLLTSDGNRIVYSDHYQDRVFVVDWDGGNRRAVCKGFAVEVWQDPSDGTQWVYAASRVGSLEDYVYRDVFRVQLDDPKIREAVWSPTQISPDNFQLSADGRRAAGEFPWPNSGLADLQQLTWEKRSTGCWASLAPDNSYVTAVFDGPHRNWQLHSSDGQSVWKVNLSPVELFEGHEVFHPRWSNHVRFLTLTGPYKIKGSVNEISGGGPEVEVYLAQLSEEFDRIVNWIRISHNNRGDFFPDAWISGGDLAQVPASVAGSAQAPVSRQQWPTSTDRMQFVWVNGSQQNEVFDQASNQSRSCRVEARGWARLDCHFAMRCGAGFFELDDQSSVAIRETLAADSDFSIELLLTPSEVLPPERSATVFELGAVGQARIAVQQRKDALGIVVHDGLASHAKKIAQTEIGRPQHVVISVAGGRITCWLDGRRIETHDFPTGIQFRTESKPFSFGADLAGKNHWPGRLERIAITARETTDDEVRRNWLLAQADLESRREPSRLRVVAECIQTTPSPDPRSLHPYRNGLLLHHFRIKETLEGQLPDRDLLVARWGVLDGESIGGSVPEQGRVLQLTLEPFEEHPQLASQRQLVDVDAIDLPVYYDVEFPIQAD
jgi:hypothetical protein